LIRKRNVDLHRSARAYRIPIREQTATQRHRADEVLIDVRELFFRSGRVETFTVGPAVRRPQTQGAAHHQCRHTGVSGASVYFFPGDCPKIRDQRVDSKIRLLLDYRNHRAHIVPCRGQPLYGKAIVDVIEPPGPVRYFLRYRLFNDGKRLRRARCAAPAGWWGLAGTTRQQRNARQNSKTWKSAAWEAVNDARLSCGARTAPNRSIPRPP
jgi:hypothetical protein